MSDIEALQAQVLARLRAGAALVTADKEVRTRVAALDGAFVFECHDQLLLGGAPMERVVLDSDAALLRWVCPTPDTAEGWAALVRLLGGVEAAVPFQASAYDGLVVFGALPDGAPWVAHVEGVGDRWVAGAMAPHVRVQVTLGDATPESPASAGPFCWWLAAQADDPGWIEGAVSARLAERLALARWLDLSTPSPLDGGTFTARHADRYDTEGVGFVVRVSLRDGLCVDIPVDLARPGTADPAREIPAARTRLRRAASRSLRT